jgi:hypothetical protein
MVDHQTVHQILLRFDSRQQMVDHELRQHWGTRVVGFWPTTCRILVERQILTLVLCRVEWLHLVWALLKQEKWHIFLNFWQWRIILWGYPLWASKTLMTSNDLYANSSKIWIISGIFKHSFLVWLNAPWGIKNIIVSVVSIKSERELY